MLTETVGDEDGVGGGVGEGMARAAWRREAGRVSAMIHEIEP